MTHQYPDNELLVSNPNDPWHREWGTSSAMIAIVAVMAIASIIAYGASVAGYF
jgi:hypothetical protein